MLQKKILALVFPLLLVFMLSFLFLKNISPLKADQKQCLWIVTEQTTSDGMNSQLQLTIDNLKVSYPNIDFTVEILPISDVERLNRINDINKSIKSNSGPDIYLMPTSNLLIIDEPIKYTYRRVLPLFDDVNLAIRQGYFMDITDYYVSDSSIDHNSINKVVINAGVYNGSQYVLPLRYNIPVLYVDETYMQSNNYETIALKKGFNHWMEYVNDTQDSVLAGGAEYISLNVFSNIIDYNSKEVSIQKDVCSNYFTNTDNILALLSSQSQHRNKADLRSYIHHGDAFSPIRIGTLDNALDHISIAKLEGRSLGMYPVTSIEGEYIATVTYYAAIGKDCSNPDIAYKLISQFLHSEYQWENNRDTPPVEQYPGLIERGWPVLTYNSTQNLWNNYKLQVASHYSSNSLYDTTIERIHNLILDDEDLALLDCSINIARFPIILPESFDSIILEYRIERNTDMVYKEISSYLKEIIK